MFVAPTYTTESVFKDVFYGSSLKFSIAVIIDLCLIYVRGWGTSAPVTVIYSRQFDNCGDRVYPG